MLSASLSLLQIPAKASFWIPVARDRGTEANGAILSHSLFPFSRLSLPPSLSPSLSPPPPPSCHQPPLPLTTRCGHASPFSSAPMPSSTIQILDGRSASSQGQTLRLSLGPSSQLCMANWHGLDTRSHPPSPQPEASQRAKVDRPLRPGLPGHTHTTLLTGRAPLRHHGCRITGQ